MSLKSTRSFEPFRSVLNALAKNTVTLLMVTYNQERYVRAAVLGALSQEGPPIEIVIADDCSTDATISIVRDIVSSYRGRHAVKVIQTSTNQGILGNFLNGVGSSTGRWIVAAAGDDISLPRRVLTLMEYVEGDAQIVGIASGFEQINEKGSLISRDTSAEELMRSRQNMSLEQIMALLRSHHTGYNLKGAVAAWRRDLFENFPPIPNDRDLYEDGILTNRALLVGKTRIIGDVLVQYRLHDDSLSNWSKEKNRANIDEKNARYLLRSIKCWGVTISDFNYAADKGWISRLTLERCLKCIKYRISYLEVLSRWPMLSLANKFLYCLKYAQQNMVRFAIRRAIDRLRCRLAG